MATSLWMVVTGPPPPLPPPAAAREDGTNAQKRQTEESNICVMARSRGFVGREVCGKKVVCSRAGRRSHFIATQHVPGARLQPSPGLIVSAECPRLGTSKYPFLNNQATQETAEICFAKDLLIALLPYCKTSRLLFTFLGENSYIPILLLKPDEPLSNPCQMNRANNTTKVGSQLWIPF